MNEEIILRFQIRPVVSKNASSLFKHEKRHTDAYVYLCAFLVSDNVLLRSSAAYLTICASSRSELCEQMLWETCDGDANKENTLPCEYREIC